MLDKTDGKFSCSAFGHHLQDLDYLAPEPLRRAIFVLLPFLRLVQTLGMGYA